MSRSLQKIQQIVVLVLIATKNKARFKPVQGLTQLQNSKDLCVINESRLNITFSTISWEKIWQGQQNGKTGLLYFIPFEAFSHQLINFNEDWNSRVKRWQKAQRQRLKENSTSPASPVSPYFSYMYKLDQDPRSFIDLSGQ